jgi:hypothetical protein
VKQGDLVEIVERSMGMCIPLGVIGMVIRNSKPSDIPSLDMWEVLLDGIVKSISHKEVRLIKSIAQYNE